MKKTLLLFFCLPLLTLAQSSPNLLRSTISNSGGSTQTQYNYVVQQSVGQISPIGLKVYNEHTVRQGFIQPAQLKRMLAASNAGGLYEYAADYISSTEINCCQFMKMYSQELNGQVTTQTYFADNGQNMYGYRTRPVRAF
tara:strand:+ start:93 stop:512 length:420 start_codon:yes stop_codon:yes gene_type:complete